MSDLILKEAIDNLSDDDVSVRKEAVNALIGVTDIEAIDPLIEATTDDNAQIRFKAAEILGNMGEVARDKLIEKFEASEGKNKRFLTFALKETKDEKVIPYFAGAVEDDDFGVRKTAIRALGELQAHDELYTIAKTDFGKVGIGICYDIRFPELAKLMAEAGAQILFYPGAFNMTTGPAHWELTFRSRALDNQVYCVGVAPALNKDASYHSYGHSIIANPWGEVIVQLDEQENMEIAEIDLEEIKKVRTELPLLKNKRSDLYKINLI